MNSLLERFSDKARAAFYWAHLCTLREGKKQVSPVHLLVGVQHANQKLFSQEDLNRIGLTPLEVGDIEKVQQEMQKLSMEASLSAGQEHESGALGYMIPFTATAKLAVETAGQCSESLGNRTVGTTHFLYGIFSADPFLAGKMSEVGWTKDRVLSLCRSYKDGEEGESMAQTMEKIRGRTFRSGIGYDLHRLAEGRKLIVGGIELPFDKGPVGHSDGDVLAHAMCDAILGAAGAGDIGTHFPDTDPKWKGANSLLFLEHTRKLIDEKGFDIEFVDAVVIMEKPKLGPHFPKMREALAKALGVGVEKIHLKAKTNEGVDAIGRGEAIAAHVVATLTSR
jgi:2-C-methyl-D-erythritol 2,4-cyclodiphosphate synthase